MAVCPVATRWVNTIFDDVFTHCYLSLHPNLCKIINFGRNAQNVRAGKASTVVNFLICVNRRLRFRVAERHSAPIGTRKPTSLPRPPDAATAPTNILTISGLIFNKFRKEATVVKFISHTNATNLYELFFSYCSKK